METIQINKERLLWCCREFGETLEDVLEHLKISNINGEGIFSIPQLKKIANYFKYDILFFLEKKNFQEDKVYSPQFRTLSSQKPTLSGQVKNFIRQTERQRSIYLGLLEDLAMPIKKWYPKNLEISNDYLLNLDDSKFMDFCQRVRSWLGMEPNKGYLFEQWRKALENKGLLIILSNGYKGTWQLPKEDAVRAFSLYFEEMPIIAIKKQSIAYTPETFSLLHELAHLLIHKRSFIDNSRDFDSHKVYEKMANKFAAWILLPEYLLNKIDYSILNKKPIQDYNSYLRPYAKQWNISVEVILRRFLDKGLLTQKNYNLYREYQQLASEKYAQKRSGGQRLREKEPIKIFGQAYVNTVLDAFNAQKITLLKASRYLDNLKIKYLHKLEK